MRASGTVLHSISGGGTYSFSGIAGVMSLISLFSYSFIAGSIPGLAGSVVSLVLYLLFARPRMLDLLRSYPDGSFGRLVIGMGALPVSYIILPLGIALKYYYSISGGDPDTGYLLFFAGVLLMFYGLASLGFIAMRAAWDVPLLRKFPLLFSSVPFLNFAGWAYAYFFIPVVSVPPRSTRIF